MTPGGNAGAVASAAARRARWPGSLRCNGLPPYQWLASRPSPPAASATSNKRTPGFIAPPSQRVVDDGLGEDGGQHRGRHARPVHHI